MATEELSDRITITEEPNESLKFEIVQESGEGKESLLERPKDTIEPDEQTETVEEVIELTEEEKAEIAIRNEEIARKREVEIKLLYELGEKFTPSEVSDIKIHITIDIGEWKKAMNGHELIEYLHELSKRGPKPSLYITGKLDHPPVFTAKKIGHYLFRLGKKELSNEARCIEILTSMDKISEDSTVESFFQSLLNKIATEGQYNTLFTELRYKTKTNPSYIGQILEDLAEEEFFKRNLVEFCATLDYKGLYKWREKIQNQYILSFDTRYTDKEFQDIFLRLARDRAATEPKRQPEEIDD